MDIFPERLPLRGEAIEKRSSKASPSRGGGSAQPRRRGRAGKRQPLSRLRRQLPWKGSLWVRSVGAGLCSARGCRSRRKNGRSRAPPLQGPRKKVKFIWISKAPSIDSNGSKATSCKLGTSVSGGAQYDTRRVTIEWNTRRKHWASPKFRCRKHQTHPSAPFLPLLFRQDGKEGAAGGESETTTTERAAASDVSFPLCSFLPFQTAN